MMLRLFPMLGGLLLASCVMLFSVDGFGADEAPSDAKLQSFATAVLAVNQVVEKWRPQLDRASDQQKQGLAQQANDEMRAAVEQTGGITVEEYQKIAQAARSDPQLMQRIDGLLSNMIGTPPSGQAGQGQQ